MNNIEIILILLMAGGFGYVITKVNKVIDICSLLVSIQLGKVTVEQEDEGLRVTLTDEEDEE